MNRSVTSPASLAIGPVLVLPTEAPGLERAARRFRSGTAAGEPIAVAKALIDEADRGDAENIVAWRRGRRWVRRYDRLALPAADPDDYPSRRRGSISLREGWAASV